MLRIGSDFSWPIAAALLVACLSPARAADARVRLLAERSSSWFTSVRNFEGTDARVAGAGGVLILMGNPWFVETGIRIAKRGGSWLESDDVETTYESTYLGVPAVVGRRIPLGPATSTLGVGLTIVHPLDNESFRTRHGGVSSRQEALSPIDLWASIEAGVAIGVFDRVALVAEAFVERGLVGIHIDGAFRTADRLYPDGSTNRAVGLRFGVEVGPNNKRMQQTKPAPPAGRSDAPGAGFSR